MAMISAGIRKQIYGILDASMVNHRKAEMLMSVAEQMQKEAYATGKAQAYREMFSVIRELAGMEKAAKAADETKDMKD